MVVNVFDGLWWWLNEIWVKGFDEIQKESPWFRHRGNPESQPRQLHVSEMGAITINNNKIRWRWLRIATLMNTQGGEAATRTGAAELLSLAWKQAQLQTATFAI